MKRRMLWVLVSSLMVLSLTLASCGPAAPEDVEGGQISVTEKAGDGTTTTPVTPTEAPSQEPVVSSDEPQYGGTMFIALGADIREFDPIDGC